MNTITLGTIYPVTTEVCVGKPNIYRAYIAAVYPYSIIGQEPWFELIWSLPADQP